MNKETGGPAYPTRNYQTTMPLSTGYSEGMTLRDYFAAKAMQGILFEGLDPAETAKHAYEMADAMLEARKT